MKLKVFVEAGQVVPLGYGKAWYDPVMDGKVCYVIPLHFFVRVFRDIYYRISSPAMSRLDKYYAEKTRAAYNNGREVECQNTELLSRCFYELGVLVERARSFDTVTYEEALNILEKQDWSPEVVAAARCNGLSDMFEELKLRLNGNP